MKEHKQTTHVLELPSNMDLSTFSGFDTFRLTINPDMTMNVGDLIECSIKPMGKDGRLIIDVTPIATFKVTKVDPSCKS